jgi:hypothetical protein
MPDNIRFLISHIAKSDPHLYQALNILAGDNAPNPNIITVISDVTVGLPQTITTTQSDVSKVSLQLNTNGNYIIYGSFTMNGDNNTGACDGVLVVEGQTQNDVAKAYVAAGTIFNMTVTQIWPILVTQPTNIKLQVRKASNAGTAQLSQCKMIAVLLP